MKTPISSRILILSLLAPLAGGLIGCGRSGPDSRRPAAAGLRVYRVGIASYAPEAAVDRLLEGLFAALKKEGFVRSENLDGVHKMAG